MARSGKTLSPHEIARFLEALARTGNFALACDRLGRAKSGLYKRRARDPLFAARCQAALAEFRLQLSSPAFAGEVAVRRTDGGANSSPSGGGGSPPGLTEGAPSGASRHLPQRGRDFLTAPGALILSPGTGKRPPQVRRSPAGRLTEAGVEEFLKTLAATANVRLAANSVGVAHSSIYRRARTDPAFASAMHEALDIGHDLVEQQILQSALAAVENLFLPSTSGEGEGAGASYPPLDFEGRGTAEGGGGASLSEPDHPPFDFAAPPEHTRPGIEPAANPATLTIHRALWLLKYRREARLPEGWSYAPKGYQPNARDRMTDEEARAELVRRMKALRRMEED